jgi:DNA polymerase-3 subunit beta
MRFSIQRETLLSPLQRVAAGVDRRQTMAILSNVLIRVESDRLFLQSNDLEIELIAEIPLEPGSVPGETTVLARKLIELCRALPDKSVLSFQAENDKMIVKCAKSRYSLATLPTDEFPETSDERPEAEFLVVAEHLKGILDRTAFAMAQQDVRYFLNGLLLEITPDQITAVATDGHRLAIAKLKKPVNTTGYKIIVPRKGVTELLRLLAEEDDTVQVQLTANHLRVIGTQFTLTTQLIDGDYPDYTRVIPAAGNKIIQVDRDLLRKALQRASVLSSEQMRGVHLILNDNHLKMVASNAELEQAEEELDVSYQGSELDIAFNVSYLLDALQHLEPGLIQITATDATVSVVVETPQEPEPFSTLHVVMPMHL